MPAPVEVLAMNRRYLRCHLSDEAVDRSLASNNRQELGSTADLLADIAEFDARKLFRQAGYSSMFAFCVGHLRRSEVAAYKRIRVARAARRFPVIFEAIADGRLHLSGVVLLAPHLTEHSAEGLLAAATNRTTREIERLLADRFPRPDLPTRVQPIPAGPRLAPGSAEDVPRRPAGDDELTLRSVGGPPERAPGDDELTLRSVGEPREHVSGHDELTLRSVGGPPENAPGHEGLASKSVPGLPVPPPTEHLPSLKPIAPLRYALQVTIDQQTHDDLRYAQDLLSHELPAGDVATVLGMALRALIPQLEKRRFAAMTTPRRGRRGGRSRRSRRSASVSPRSIPPEVRRAVWMRDGGQCTFVSQDGHRCAERRFVEFDHVQEVARGGLASIAGLRLRCRAHNQYAAELTFGADFMRHKRSAAAAARAEAKVRRRGGQSSATGVPSG